MLTTILGALSALGSFLGELFEFLSGERLRKLGRLEAESEATDKAIHDLTTAQAIDDRPVPSDVGTVLDGLRPPSDRQR